jgi:hypothetical protein
VLSIRALTTKLSQVLAEKLGLGVHGERDDD